MTYYNTKEIEEIAIAKVKEMVRKTCNRRVGCELSENDKGPSWDGHILLYKVQNSLKVEDIDDRFPVQVKGTEVSKFDNKFISYPIKISDLKNYLAEGIIYFVVEILPPNEEFKVFYKVLNSMEIQLILDDIDESKGQKTKNIKIDSIMNERTRFDKECEKFKKYRQYQSLELVKNAIPLERIDISKIELIDVINPQDAINSKIYPFVRDEYNQLIPIRTEFKISEIRKIINRPLIKDGKKYFDTVAIAKNENSEYMFFGDRIEYNIIENKVNLKKSEGNIHERLMTLEFFMRYILDEKSSNYIDEIEGLQNEADYLKRIIKLCDRFNIDKEKIYTKKLTQNDINQLEILENIKSAETYDFNIHRINITKCELEIIRFLNNKILLFSVKYDNECIYFDFYDKKFNLELNINRYKDIPLSRFIMLNFDLLICKNFNYEVVKYSMSRYPLEAIKFAKDNYLNVALEAIKAWDESKNEEYINLSEFILDLLKDIMDSEILFINGAQIEYRQSKGNLKQSTIEQLYKLKFVTENDWYKAGIQILLKDKEGFEETFNKLKDKETFKTYPIYHLYEDLSDKEL